MNVQKTKRQHYVPVGYLKNFATDEKKVYTYNVEYNKYYYKSVSSICYHNLTYESENIIDNKLENMISRIENDAIKEIQNLLTKVYNGEINESIDSLNINLLWKYMWLQEIRTDAGRIKFIEYFENILNYCERKGPVNQEEVKKKYKKIDLFNKIMKNEFNFDFLLSSFINRNNYVFRVGIAQDGRFLTCDNPIICFYGHESRCEDLKFIYPISPYVCIQFLIYFRNVIPNNVKPICILPKQSVDKCNKAIINVANYWIVSNDNFLFFEKNEIYIRHVKKEILTYKV